MPRKTLALIAGLVIITIVLFIIAVKTNPATKPPASDKTTMQPAPTSVAHSVLSLSPNPVVVAPGTQGKVAVTIDTSDNAVTAVQLELGYDPTIVSNVQVTPGTLFPNSVVLINKNNAQAGRLTYAIGISPSNPTINGTGTVANITFTVKSTAKAGQEMQLGLLPTTLVTARGVQDSVLKTSAGTVVTVGTPGGATQ